MKAINKNIAINCIFGFLVVVGVLAITKILTSPSHGRTPDMVVQDTKNQPFSFAQSEKFRLITFWATSCASCIEEMPSFKKLQQALPDRLEVVTVAMFYDDKEKVDAFMINNDYTFTSIIDNDKKIADAFGGIYLTPTNFLVDKKGNIIFKKIGIPNIETWKKRIEQG